MAELSSCQEAPDKDINTLVFWHVELQYRELLKGMISNAHAEKGNAFIDHTICHARRGYQSITIRHVGRTCCNLKKCKLHRISDMTHHSDKPFTVKTPTNSMPCAYS